MGEPSFEVPSAEKVPEERLDSWKEIAAYLNRDVTTVQRWEKREGMPVHRHIHDRKGSVYASRAELDQWMLSRKSPLPEESNGGSVSSIAAPEAISPRQIPWRFLLPALALVAVLAISALLWIQRTEYFWHDPIANAQFQALTDWGGLEQAATVSRDGQFVAFLSDRGGPMDVWVTQVGSGQFHNLTQGSAAELVNPSVRTLGFSPDGSLVTFWVRKPDPARGTDVSIWAVPTLGGPPRPYLEGVAEYDWTSDGQRLAFHTPGPGDPLFVSSGSVQGAVGPIFSAPAGLHSHFPVWSPDKKFIYFVQGSLPDNLDIWRIPAGGGNPERITSHNSQVSYPAFLDQRTLMYLATDSDGSGPSLYSMDVERRIAHRLTTAFDRYTSLAASADGRRVVLTLATPRTTLWRLPIDPSHGPASAPAPITLTTGNGFRPRLGPDCLLYVSANGASESISNLANGGTTELWRGQGAQITGSPAVSADGRFIAFSVRQDGRALLYVMGIDGTDPRVVADSLELEGDPAWGPDSRSVITAAMDHGSPHLFRVPLSGGAPSLFTREYSLDPTWAPDGSVVVFSGPDVGTTFSVQAAQSDGSARQLPPLTLTRGARHLVFKADGRQLVVLRGEIKHKNLWLIDLDTGAEKQLTDLPSDFEIRDFDLSPDGREAVLERVQDHFEVVLANLNRK